MQFIFLNSDKDKEVFKLEKGMRSWNVMFFLEKGKFEYRLEGEKAFTTVNEKSVMIFPKNTPFERKVLEKITYRQIGYIEEPSDGLVNMSSGEQNIRKETFSSSLLMLEKGEDKSDFLGGCLAAVKFIIWENYINNQSITEREKIVDEDVKKIIEYFNDHLSEKISLLDVAKKLNVTHNGLIYKFKKSLKQTPLIFLNNLRLTRAKRLLQDTDLRISEIAFECGFNDAYYFSNTFKKEYGISPLKYRITIRA